jgi:hypothetical protein
MVGRELSGTLEVMVDIPPRNATQMGSLRRIDITFDVDLGELVSGHHVVARGLEFADTGTVLHYEFVPGITQAEQHEKGAFFWYWLVFATDDCGTRYEDSNSGGFDGRSGGAASHGDRDFGGIVPRKARRLTLRFEPAAEWSPPGSWRRELVIDLAAATSTRARRP